MRKLYSLILLISFFCASTVRAEGFLFSGGLYPDTTKRTKITDTRPNKPSILQKGIGVKVVPFKPNPSKTFSSSSGSARNVQSDKVLNNVKVYPNPVSDQLNLSYQVTRESDVTIKVMDVLGNEVITLLSQRQSAGEKNISFDISSKLNSGFYFVRLIVGRETIIKRISVL